MTRDVFAKLKQQLYNAIETIKCSGVNISLEQLDSFIISQLMFINDVTNEERRAIRLYLESHLFVKHDHNGYIIADNDDTGVFSDWYTNSDHRNEHFWKLYKQYLINEESLDFTSLNKLGEVTLPRLMNCLNNPKQQLSHPRVRYGMVIGDVQSGKTSTYAGLICKAADAGMKVVILLAGQTESLRQQTQERMEESIVGYTIRTDGERNSKQLRVGVGMLPEYKPIVTAYTSYEDDFKVGHDKTMSSLESQSSLVMFIVKKNVPVLKRLYKWLVGDGQNKRNGKLPYSLLLIDDEADNASINTKKDAYNPTKTNAIIRKICEVFENSNYVGFTATPYANIFINPEKDEKMETCDLFPKDFIYVLPTPDAYIGALRIFSEPDADNPSYGNCGYMLKYITDIVEPTQEVLSIMNQEDKNFGPLFYKHSSDWRGTLPKSLDDALKCFYLSNAIRDLEGAKSTPRTMLVNISRFQTVESYVKSQLSKQVAKDYKEILCNVKGVHEVDMQIPLYKQLYDLFVENYASYCYCSFAEVLDKNVILGAIENIRVIVVNGTKESKEDAPDYKTNPSQRIIAVGGLALSRGLTLKNLMISYFYRNTATYDTLMQMGRWFGYRSKYERLCRIWITQSSANWYREIAEATEELKKSLRNMDKQKLTPKDFGLKIRRDDVALAITARNKMRNSIPVVEFESFWGDVFETPYFSKIVKDNTENVNATKCLLSKIEEENIIFEKKNNSSAMLAKDIPVMIILDFLKKIHVSAANHRFPLDAIIGTIVTDIDNSDELKFWDVAIAGGKGETCVLSPSVTIKKSVRKLTDWSENVYSFTNRGVVGGNNDGEIGLDNPSEIKEEYVRIENKSVSRKTWFKYAKRKPLLILYPVVAQDPNNYEAHFQNYLKAIGNDPIMGFAVGFPGYGHPASVEHSSYGNVIYQKQNQTDEEEVDDEDLN